MLIRDCDGGSDGESGGDESDASSSDASEGSDHASEHVPEDDKSAHPSDDEIHELVGDELVVPNGA